MTSLKKERKKDNRSHEKIVLEHDMQPGPRIKETDGHLNRNLSHGHPRD